MKYRIAFKSPETVTRWRDEMSSGTGAARRFAGRTVLITGAGVVRANCLELGWGVP